MKNNEKNSFAGAIAVLKAEFLRLQQNFADLAEDEKIQHDEITRAIALLSGELPVFAHLYCFGEDNNISLHLTEGHALEDVRDVWKQHRFVPDEDGSIVFSARLNGDEADGLWVLTEEGGLVSSYGDELIGFSIDQEDAQPASSEPSLEAPAVQPVDWERYDLTAQVVATQKFTIDDDCESIDWDSIEEITGATLVMVHDQEKDLVFDVDVRNMEDDEIIPTIVKALQEHERELGLETKE
ncbi:hypothetical protein [Paenibacillus abyssi]|uniref:Uncharacterized protein n=1 Tax=Paenibacillus abyssi TaxID=1340531 RepID=A0A917LFL6_9BACL|nr:hypothetical protein [Paenibacillus abyssi]GGG18556.1 hypothetical protein GCM10010916_39220 [Paenibacillus abyssi]